MIPTNVVKKEPELPDVDLPYRLMWEMSLYSENNSASASGSVKDQFKYETIEDPINVTDELAGFDNYLFIFVAIYVFQKKINSPTPEFIIAVS